MLTLVEHVLEDMNKQLYRIQKSLDLLNEDHVWTKIKPHLNSIGNLCLHLAGNEYQNLVSAIGKQPFIRERSQEFATTDGCSKQELIDLLVTTRAQSKAVLTTLTTEDLSKEVIIRYDYEDWNRMLQVNAAEDETFEVKVIERLLVQVASHYGYHTGQIVLLTKLLEDTEEHITGQYH